MTEYKVGSIREGKRNFASFTLPLKEAQLELEEAVSEFLASQLGTVRNSRKIKSHIRKSWFTYKAVQNMS